MLQRKIKAWWIKRKLRMKREKQIGTVGDIINLENEAHKTYLSHGRHGIKYKDEELYWKGRRDGIRSIWKQKAK